MMTGVTRRIWLGLATLAVVCACWEVGRAQTVGASLPAAVPLMAVAAPPDQKGGPVVASIVVGLEQTVTPGIRRNAGDEFDPSAGPDVATVGIFLVNINDIDVKSSVFMLDFYIWFHWRGELDPSASFEFLNVVDRWGMTRDAIYGEPEVLADGSKYQIFHVQGKFNRKFDLRDYPLDVQTLPIEVEDSRHQVQRLTYRADVAGSQFDPAISVPGWSVDRHTAVANEYHYPTDFGRPQFQRPGAPPRGERYARFTFAVEVSRPWGPYLFRMLVPLLVVLFASFVVFLLSGKYVDARIGISVTALLTAVALHLTVSADLPQVGYIRLIDRIYNLVYAVIFVTLLESVGVIHWHDVGQHAWVKKLDRWCLVIMPTVSVVGLLVLIAWR